VICRERGEEGSPSVVQNPASVLSKVKQSDNQPDG
jgi:hypothetical protein